MPSRREFLEAIEAEFAFLTEEDGYSREVTGEFDVEFTHGGRKLRLVGANYGQAMVADFLLDGTSCPLGGFFSGRSSAPEQHGDAPQLNDIRRLAWIFKHELRGLVQGRPEALETARRGMRERERVKEIGRRNRAEGEQAAFLAQAERLFKAGDYAACARHLEASPQALTDSWKARLDYARKHS
jgi:hypothetical protein